VLKSDYSRIGPADGPAPPTSHSAVAAVVARRRFDEQSKGGVSVNLKRNGREAARNGQDGKFPELGAAPGLPIVTEIPVNNGPISGVAASSDGSRLMVTNYARNSVSVIDTDACRVLDTVPGVSEPFAIAVGSADAGRAYVSTASTAYDSIEVIDVSTNMVVASHPLALSVSDLVVSADGRYVYASRNGVRGVDVAVLDTTTGLVEVIDIADPCKAPGTTTECVRIGSDGDRLYVGANGPAGGQLVVIGTPAQSDQDADQDAGRGRCRPKDSKKSTRSREAAAHTGLSVVGAVAIGLPVRDVALSANGAIAYVASCGADCDAVIDVIDTQTSKIVSTRKISEVGGLLTGLTLSGDGDRAYLVGGHGVTVLCTLTLDVVGTIQVAKQPSCVVESPDGNHLYIADYSGAVTVAAVGSAITSDVEDSVDETDAAAEWAMPELLQYEPALA
jgi:YVTN family beta-propeller protein